MSQSFFEHPIINSPYDYPDQHWELDKSGQPTNLIIHHRRIAEFITPIPKPKKRKRQSQQEMVFNEAREISTSEQQYEKTAAVINQVREQVDRWRKITDQGQWKVTPETTRLLQHWRHHKFSGVRPFFCQVEAAETAIWLTEVAPDIAIGKQILAELSAANEASNPGLSRLALKLATGAGKTTVMAMLIAWQTVNAVRRPGSRKFTRGFLIVTPGLTIRDRLRVLQPNDPDSYYKNREMLPNDMLADLDRAKIVITNYHAFRRRETVELAAGSRMLLQGRGPELNTLETEGQMLQRVMPSLMGIKGVMVLNDEAHHCYQVTDADAEQPAVDKPDDEDRDEFEEQTKAAQLWISGLHAVQQKIGVRQIIDLSATPFFLSGANLGAFVQNTLFPWTMSDFSLMDAIECGIVKLPRVPVADNIPNAEVPIFRELWKHIGKQLPRSSRTRDLDPQKLPTQLLTALDALYGHYVKTFEAWRQSKISVPPCFIVVCQNIAISKLVYDYISGFFRKNADESATYIRGALELFRNADDYDNPLPRPRTLLINSEQLESGEALDPTFREMAGPEIEQFRRDIIDRTKDVEAAKNLKDSDLLREVMNTVGRTGRLGESIRCVVSVSMLTEGWDANTVTHVLGIRAFGTQLLCEQVIGRALRRQSYDLNEDQKFNVEYADVLGIPFDFTAKPVPPTAAEPRETVNVRAVRPQRDSLEITFPRISGYRVELPNEQLTARFTVDSTLELTPQLVGPTLNEQAGIIGKTEQLTVKHLGDVRQSTVLYHLTERLMNSHWRDANGQPKMHLFPQLKRIARQWLDQHLICRGNTVPAMLMYPTIGEIAAKRITEAIIAAHADTRPVVAIVDHYNPTGTTAHVNFNTSKTDRFQPSPEKCQTNWIITDSDWEMEFCRVAESHPRVRRYVKNHNLGFEVPYRYGSETRIYRPDFIVIVDDGGGDDDLLNLVVEIKGYRGEDAKEKKATMDTLWVPGVNYLGTMGRWAFAEFTDVWEIDTDFKAKIESHFNAMIEKISPHQPVTA